MIRNGLNSFKMGSPMLEDSHNRTKVLIQPVDADGDGKHFG